MTKKIAHTVLIVSLGIGIIGSGFLVIDEFTHSNICPKVFSIPACYLIFLWFIGLSLFHFLKAKPHYFYALAIFPLLIASYGTVTQVFGIAECPKTGSGIPMCYISLALFSAITYCKYLLSKKYYE